MSRSKIYSGIALMLCIQLSVLAQTTQKLSLDKATVFIRGAELTSTAKITLAKGENEFVFTNVAGDINNQSIAVSASNGAVVESVTFQNNYTNTDNESPKIKELKDSIAQVEVRKQPLNNKVAAINELIAILQNNRKVGGNNTGLSVAEMQKMLDMVGSKLESYLMQKDKAESEIKKLSQRIVALTKQLNEEQKRGYQPGGQLLVRFYSKEATTSNITISYVVQNAGWVPVYDVWVGNTSVPATFYYKANIYQNCGVKWNNVHLTLSTDDAQQGLQAPILTPQYLSFYRQQPQVTMYGNQTGEDVFTTETYTSGTFAVAQPKAKQSTVNEYVKTYTSGVSTRFDIELPYTIPSDGQQHLVAVKIYEMAATYQYYSAPKADDDAFLLARITDWEDMNLLPGKTSIFYEGTYVGHGAIDPKNITDTLNVSLGRDKKIVVKRERDKSYRSVKMIGSNVREEYAYNITVRNTRKETITILVNDQLPISNDKEIVIEDIQIDGASYNETTGMLVWPLTLKGNESKTIKFGYTLKYPKGKTIQ